MADRMCAFGNCVSYETPIAVSWHNGGERVRFCCGEHAALWLLRRQWGRGRKLRDHLDKIPLKELFALGIEIDNSKDD